MSKATELANSLRIYNDHEVSRRFGRPGDSPQMPFIYYQPADNGRAAHYAYWGVSRPGYKTDPSAGYPTYGTKRLDVRSRDEKEPMRLQAIAMCNRKYQLGDVEWKRSPFGGWHPAPVIDALQAALKTASK